MNILTRNRVLSVSKKTKINPTVTKKIIVGKTCGKKPLIIDHPQSKPEKKANKEVKSNNQARLSIWPPKINLKGAVTVIVPEIQPLSG
ncbi:MAG: hypothetical protein UW88_C0001G0122 [Candidatus Collierbacteria bacterium GW2011_GWD2_45_10]|nr:MAG: hypothetical protein UW56_C0009G0041 [Candidatus Collierbacteria bacterium GW2011_GWD1_44_27]KKT89742.1 MAG: hypothetical protein UW88_C0001G0122 [Candidatus Collierbacteria bacterium GW2011_GWD2_45_10]